MIRQTLLTGWNFMRWIRFGFGILIAVQAIKMHDAFSGTIAAFFLFQAVTNTGCCGSNGCAVPTTNNDINKIEDVEYEEIKSKQT